MMVCCMYRDGSPLMIRLSTCVYVRVGGGGQAAGDRGDLRHEDPQQVGDAQTGRGERPPTPGTKNTITVEGLSKREMEWVGVARDDMWGNLVISNQYGAMPTECIN